MKSLCILGRQPKICIAELESLYGSETLQAVGNQAVVLDEDPIKINFRRLGGTVKFCKILTTLDTINWRKIQAYLEKAVPEHATHLPDGKMKLGLSLYGFEVTVSQINATGLAVKKAIKQTGRSIRVVPNTESALNSAQTLHNQLTSALGWELVFVRDGNKTVLAQNIAEQDIEAYAQRDQGRPKRDSKVGMLPPKLAQIIINLAVGQIKILETRDQSIEDSSLQTLNSKLCILDPFCGTGVLLQEALLMGYSAYGTDIDSRMIEFTKTNLDWLSQKSVITQKRERYLEIGDATNHLWKQQFKAVASEVYLGRPFTTPPPSDVLKDVIQTTNLIIKKFLQNLANQTNTDTRLCLAIPAWVRPTQHSSLPISKANSSAGVSDTNSRFSSSGLAHRSRPTASSAPQRENGSSTQMRSSDFIHLPVLDHLTDMGYNRLSFVHVKNEDLIYHREGQIVARELLVLTRT